MHTERNIQPVESVSRFSCSFTQKIQTPPYLISNEITARFNALGSFMENRIKYDMYRSTIIIKQWNWSRSWKPNLLKKMQQACQLSSDKSHCTILVSTLDRATTVWFLLFPMIISPPTSIQFPIEATYLREILPYLH